MTVTSEASSDDGVVSDDEYHPTHDMVLDGNEVDIWRVEAGFHNGPECLKCGSWCHHCYPDRASKPCPSADSPA